MAAASMHAAACWLHFYTGPKLSWRLCGVTAGPTPHPTPTSVFDRAHRLHERKPACT